MVSPLASINTPVVVGIPQFISLLYHRSSFLGLPLLAVLLPVQPLLRPSLVRSTACFFVGLVIQWPKWSKVASGKEGSHWRVYILPGMQDLWIVCYLQVEGQWHHWNTQSCWGRGMLYIFHVFLTDKYLQCSWLAYASRQVQRPYSTQCVGQLTSHCTELPLRPKVLKSSWAL